MNNFVAEMENDLECDICRNIVRSSARNAYTAVGVFRVIPFTLLATACKVARLFYPQIRGSVSHSHCHQMQGCLWKIQ